MRRKDPTLRRSFCNLVIIELRMIAISYPLLEKLTYAYDEYSSISSNLVMERSARFDSGCQEEYSQGMGLARAP